MGKQKLQKMMSCSVNLKLLPLKLHFFLFAAGVASSGPYLPLFAKEAGLSTTAIGVLYFAIPVASSIAKPFFGWLADKYRRDKCILIGMLLISVIFYFVMPFTPSIPKERNAIMEIECVNYSVKINPVNSTCLLGPKRLQNCKIVCTQCKNESPSLYNCENQLEYRRINVTIWNSRRFINSSEIICPTNSTQRCEVVCPCDEWCCSINSEYQTSTFWIFFICIIFVGTADKVLRGLSDSICFEMLKDRTNDYGKQKLWNTLALCGAPFLAGYLLDVTRTGTTYNYSVVIYLSAAFMIVDIITSYKLDLDNSNRKTKSTGICKDTLSFFSEFRHLVFTVAACIGGMMYGFDLVYYNIFMQEIGASKLLIGISLAGGVFTRIPLLFYSGNIIQALGHLNAMALAFVCVAVRFISLAHIYNPFWVLLPQIALCSAIDMVVLITSVYSKHWAPPGTEATLQQTTGAIFGGLGIGLGYGLGGLGFDYYGTKNTFIITAVISGACGICIFIFNTYTFFRKKQDRKEKNKALNREVNGNTKVIANR